MMIECCAEGKCKRCGAESMKKPKRGRRSEYCDDCKAATLRAAKHREKAIHKMKQSNNYSFMHSCETIIPEDIFCRDLWMCGICGKPVDRELRFPDEGSGELDHVVPLSMGGTHTKDNMQCAHRICNVIKADGTQDEAVEAISLYGISWGTASKTAKERHRRHWIA